MNALVTFRVLFEAVATHAARLCPDGDTFPLAFLALPRPGLDYVCHAEQVSQRLDLDVYGLLLEGIHHTARQYCLTPAGVYERTLDASSAPSTVVASHWCICCCSGSC